MTTPDCVTFWHKEETWAAKETKYTFLLNYKNPVVMVNQWEHHFRLLADGGLLIYQPQLDFDKYCKGFILEANHPVALQLQQYIAEKGLGLR